MKMLLRVVAMMAAATIVDVTSSPAFAGDPPAARADAKKHFQRAVVLYEEQDFRAALAEFQRAYEIAPNYKVLYDIAQAHYQLQAYSKAIDTFERYLKAGDREIARARRVEVEETLSKLRTRVATLSVSVNVTTADIAVDNEIVGSQTSAVSLKLNAGQHRVAVTAKGHLPVTRSLNLVGEDRVDLRLELEPESEVPRGVPASSLTATPPDANVALGPARSPSSPSAPSRTAVYVGLGTTSILAAGAAGLGIASLVAKGTYDRALRSTTDSPERIDDARQVVRTTSVLCDALTIAAVASGITTVVLLLTSSRSSSLKAVAGLDASRCMGSICGAF